MGDARHVRWGRRRSSGGRRLLVLLLSGLLSVGVAAMADSAAAKAKHHKVDKKALRKATKKYKQAQHKCNTKHDLSQLPKILKAAKQMHKAGGKKVSKKNLYRCVRFSVLFSSTLHVTGNSSENNRTDTDDWTYKIQDGQDRLAYVLQPDYKEASHDLVTASFGSTQAPFDYTFSGGGSDHFNGSSCTQHASANGVGGARGFGATISLDPSAKDPRKTIDLSVSPTPPDEKYVIDYCGDQSNFRGEVWKIAYYYLHKNRIAAPVRNLTCNDYTYDNIASQPDGAQMIGSRSIVTTKTAPSEPDAPLGSDVCGRYPDGGAMWNIPLKMSENTTYSVFHDPCPEKSQGKPRGGCG